MTVRYRRLGAGLACAAIALSTSPSFAETAPDDGNRERSYAPVDIVVSAERTGYDIDDGSTSTKTPTALVDTPQFVSVLTRDQIEDQDVRHLGEALRYAAGVSMETGEGHRDEIFIRGQETSSGFFLDGLRDDAQYYRSLYNIERIEILKGPNAIAFGRGGGGGVINRVSKTAQTGVQSLGLDGSVNSFGGFALSADLNQPFAPTAAGRLNATYEEFDSHRDRYEGRFFGISPTVSLQPGDRTRLVLAYSYEDDDRVTDRGIPSLGGLPLSGFDEVFFGDPDFNRAQSKVNIARFGADHELSDTLSANFSGLYADYDKVYANIVPGSIVASPDGNTVSLSGYRDTTLRENWVGQGNLVWQGETGAITHTALAGIELVRQDTRNSRDVVRFGSADGPGSARVALAQTIAVPQFFVQPLARNRDSDLSVFAAYLQDQIGIGDLVEIVAGLRYEIFDLETVDLRSGTPAARKDTKWSPRLALIVKPQENLSFYASYTESFLPQAGDQFLILSPSSADLAPEAFENIEAGVKWAIAPRLLFSAAAFQLERSNSQTTDPANPAFKVLTGKSRTRGIELQLAGEIVPGWHANLGYSYLDAEIRSQTGSAEAGTVLEQVPDHHVAAWTRYDLTPQFALGAGIVHSSRQFASLSNKVVLPAYTRVDLAAFYDISEDLSVQLNVENLFDETYYASAHGDNNIQPARPLNASISARMRF